MKDTVKKVLPAFCVMLIGIAVLLLIPSQVKAYSDTGVTTRTVPRIMAFIIVISSLLEVVFAFLRGRKENRAEAKTAVLDLKGLLRVALTIGCIVVWLLLLKPVGFPVMTALLCAAIMWIAGSRKVWQLIAVPVILTSLLYYVFKFVLYAALPAGIFPF